MDSSSDHELASDFVEGEWKGSVKEMASSSDHELASDFVEGEWKGNQAVKQEEDDEPIRKIKITKLPAETTEDTLMNYFENRRRNGGGPIESIEYHPATSSAIIEFQEADVVDRVLKKRPLLFLKKQISVEEYVEEVEEEEEEPSIHTIEVCGFAENAVEEVLEMYFENTNRSGGGEVTSVEIEDGVALVTFADADVASSVCEREHSLDGHKLNVTLHLPKKKSSAVETGREEEEAVEPVFTVEVRDYKLGTEGTIEMYFENTKRSGGDEIKKFDPFDSDGVIFITFASEEVARRVTRRQHVVSGCTLDVKLYEPPKHKSAKHLTRICSKEPEESVPYCTIEVRGVTKSLNLTTLQLYFENIKRSRGDEIVQFEYQEENEIAYITYESEEVAQRVASYGQHRVKGQPLEVKLYIPPPPRPTYTNRVLLSGLTSKVTRDCLTNFLEAKIGLTPDNFLYGEEGDKVIITFDEIIDFHKLEEACKKRALEGNHLQPSKVHVSNCILVLNLKITTTEDTIELYFENEKRSLGGPVENIVFHRDEEYCLVYFVDYTICDRVLQRKHKIDGSELQVSVHYECLGRTSEDAQEYPSQMEQQFIGLKEDTRTVQVDMYEARNTVLDKLVTCNSGIVQLIERKNKNVLDKIAKDLAHYYVQIKSQSKGGFLVRGNQYGISQATYKLQELINSVKYREHELQKPGITEYMESKGREHINFVENLVPCVIQQREKKQYGFGENNEETGDFDGFQRTAVAMDTDDSSRFAYSFTFGKINVKIYQGDITQEDADCIVNSSNTDLDLSRGAVSIAIMIKGGSSLAVECRGRADDMKRNGIAVTKGYGLNCKHVIHVVAVDSNKWTPVINKCLLKAEELKAKSIAFPALGAGVGVSPQEIDSVMFKAITDFEASGAKTITEVRIVIFQSQMVQLFVDAARNQGSGAKPKTFFGKIYSSLKGGNLEQEPRKVPLKSPQPMRPVEQTSTVWIDVYAWEKQHLDVAINKLDFLIKIDFNRVEFTESESVIKNFSPDQVSALQRLADQSRIQFTIDPKIGRITIEGVADGIMTVSNAIHKLIREADEKEQEKRSAELLKKLVQWYFIVITTESSELREYPADVNLLIETAYKDNKPFVTFFTNDGEECKIDFSKLEECSVKDPSDSLTVVRKDLIQGIIA